MREKARYLVFEVISEDRISFNDAVSAINSSIKSLFGDFGLASARLWPVKNSWKNNRGIVKVDRSFINQMKASLIVLNKINSREVIVRSLFVSGTIKKAKEFLENSTK